MTDDLFDAPVTEELLRMWEGIRRQGELLYRSDQLSKKDRNALFRILEQENKYIGQSFVHTKQ